MSILQHNELTGRSANFGVDDVNYNRLFLVETSAKTVGEFEIYQDSRTPKIGDAHPSDGSAVCYGVRVDEGDSSVTWNVTVQYSRSAGTRGVAENPVNAKPVVKFGYAAYSRDVEVENSAGDPIDPPVKKEKFNLVIYVTHNQRTYRPEKSKLYKNSMNSSAINVAGVPIGKFQGRMRNIEPVTKTDTLGKVYYAVTYEIEVDEDTHVKKVLDQGVYYMKNSKKVPILDGEENPVTDPQKLNGEGGLLEEGADKKYIEINVHPPVSWSSLRLPRSL